MFNVMQISFSSFIKIEWSATDLCLNSENIVYFFLMHFKVKYNFTNISKNFEILEALFFFD